MAFKTITIILICVIPYHVYSMEQSPNNQSRLSLWQRYAASKAAINKISYPVQSSSGIVAKPTYTGPDTSQSSLSAIYVNNCRNIVNASAPGLGNVNEVTNQMWHTSGYWLLKQQTQYPQEVVGLFPLSNGGTYLASVSGYNTLLFDLETFKHIGTLKAHANFVQSIDCCKTNFNLLVSTDLNENIKVWDIRAEKCTHTTTSTTALSSAQFNSDGTQIASSNSNQVTIWDAAMSKQLYTLDGGTYSAYNFTDTQLATGSNTVKIYNPNTGELLREFTESQDWKACFAFSHDGTQLIYGSNCGNMLTLCNPNIEKPEFIRFAIPGDIINSNMFSEDDSSILNGAAVFPKNRYSQSITVWNVQEIKDAFAKEIERRKKRDKETPICGDNLPLFCNIQ